MSSSESTISCPLHTEFRYYEHCPIDECLYHTSACDLGCIITGSVVPNTSTYGTLTKQLSIAEILFYKKDSLPKTSLRYLNSMKKSGMQRIKTIVIFSYLSPN